MPSIILSDNGVSSGSAGLKSTAASDGVLILQTTTSGGTATNAVYVDSVQNVGFGVTPTSGWYSTYKVLQLGTYGSWYTNSDHVSFANNVFTNSAGDDKYANNDYATLYRQVNGEHRFYTSSTSGSAGGSISWVTPLTLNPTGAVALSGAVTNANGTGITFPASQSASTDANTLDDYEEGTWTPSLYASNANLVSSYNGERYGSYTKIGNMVYFEARISNITLNAQTGSLTIVGLPFTSNSSYYFPIYCWMYSGMSSSGTIIIRNELSSTKLVLQSTNTSGVGRDLTQADVSGASVNWMIAGFYSV